MENLSFPMSNEFIHSGYYTVYCFFLRLLFTFVQYAFGELYTQTLSLSLPFYIHFLAMFRRTFFIYTEF